MRGIQILKAVLPYFIMAALFTIIMTPVMSRAIDSADFKRHYRRAIDRSVVDHVRHPFFHETVRAYSGLLPSATREHILLATALTFMAVLPLPIFWQLRRASRGQLSDFALIMLALGLLIMSPITLWSENKYLLGYFNPVVYHSPTLNALRPFLAPLALFALLVFERRSDPGKHLHVILIVVSAILVVLATLAKPSYTIALVPGLCLLGLWRYWRQRNVDWTLLIFGFCLPGCIVLGALYLFIFVSIGDDSSIAIGFLTVLAYHVPLWRIPFQILLSIVFPAVVYLLFLAEARRHLFLNLSWVVFIVGALMSLMIYEAGPRWRAGNFLWTSYCVTFVLMFASLSFLVERYSIERKGGASKSDSPQSRLSFRFYVAMLGFGLHVISGLAYYFRTMSEF